ncbi:sulfurtransferase [Luedemannella flava]|uniref:Sulfurtransferase n=1 Tax=Luedemannella flava TaxID=349316 RepID=A0ABP4YFC8_9ACTN
MTLIDAATLAAQLAEPHPPTVLDVRWRLGGPPGRDAYRAGHVPGAVFVDLDAELCGPPGAGGRHPLPDPDALQRVLRAAGVRAGHPVVAYDDGDGQAASRLWWTLRWAGHDDVRVLDGGFAAWTAQDRPVTDEEVTPPAGDIEVRPGGLPVVDAAGAVALADAGVLLDARVAPRYRGETEPVDPVAGHVPGAVNLPVGELSGPDGRLKPVADLAAAFSAAGVDSDRPVGAYCGSGVTAARTVLALHAAGRTDAALYVGSWSNWVADPDRPVATGENT